MMNLSEWLQHIQGLHCTDMDLSLERVREVASRLDLLSPGKPIITVGGTNGKGSCVAGLEAIYLEQGYRVGAFTSPFLVKYNEYVRVQGEEATDEAFCNAFERIERARKAVTLTPFEFTTLAALDIFKRSELDVWLLEVGLGGRFDAVNVLDADVAIIASIGIDHIEWLGETREEIALEKAGIFRPKQIAICGDFDPPETLIQYAKKLGTTLLRQNKEFGFTKKQNGWDWLIGDKTMTQLPYGQLAVQNLACVLTAVDVLQNKLPVTEENIRQALSTVHLPGRIQVIPGAYNQIWDVSHNPASAAFLAAWLRAHPVTGITRAVFSMLVDKDILGTLEVMKEWVDEWHIAELQTKRAASLEKLNKHFRESGIEKVFSYSEIENAYQQAINKTLKADRIIVFGSFHTVANITVFNSSNARNQSGLNVLREVIHDAPGSSKESY